MKKRFDETSEQDWVIAYRIAPGFLTRPLQQRVMTRFDAAEATERRKLFVDAIKAHRERSSAFLTIEAEPTEQEREAMEAEAEELPEEAAEHSVPWVQFAEQTFNVDCTDAELDRLKNLLNQYPEFRIDQLDEPEEAYGTNVRITARADANRLADFADRVFQDVYERGDDYRAWVVAI